MASKQRTPRSISLYNKTAVDILSKPALCVLQSNGSSCLEPSHRERDVTESNQAAGPGSPSLPADLIRLSSLEELLSYEDDDDNLVTEDDQLRSTLPGSSQQCACDDGISSLNLARLAANETKMDLFCNSCQTGFSSRSEQVEHYKLDWHRYNLKMKLKGLPLVDQEEFERVAGDLSSISGSESDSAHSEKEDEPRPSPIDNDTTTDGHTELTQTPFVYFTAEDKNGSQLYAIYRSVVTGLKRGGVTLEAIKSLKNEQIWIVLMRSGGHFAGSVFNGHVVVAHKTFHRYTVRAKRGTAQSVRDGQGHQPKSAGASLRRYNEATLAQEIQDLMASWDTYVKGASAIFIRTPKYSKGVLVGEGKAPFSKDDPRLRTIPFITRRPTLSEVQRVHSKLACLYRVALPQTSGTTGCNKMATHKHSPQVKKHKPTKTKGKATVSVEQDVELKLNEEGVNDEMLEQVAVDTRESSGIWVNKKKKKTKKKITEPQEVLPDAVQALLRICKQSDDDVDLLTEHLQSMNLQPLDTHTTDDRSHDSNESQSTVKSDHVGDSVTSDLSAKSRDVTSDLSEMPVENKQSSQTPSAHPLNTLWNGSTILHTAASNGNACLVSLLLLYGADPVIKNLSGKTPYSLAKDKSVRDSFRRFMASHTTAYDYTLAQIPSPLTEEMERGRKEKVNEKKKAQKKVRKQRERELKSQREEEKVSSVRHKKMSELSERERRALAAERRLASQLPSSTAVVRAGTCSNCSKSLAGVVPFERLTFSYCTMYCLKEHRDQTTGPS